MKSHRGISAIVGTVFLIAIVVGALSYITYSLETMANFSEQLIAVESRQRDIAGEKFELVSVDITGTTLDAVIKNNGQIPLKITTLYLDRQGVNDVVNKTVIDVTIAPGKSFNFLDEGINVVVDPTAGYSMKLVSSRGETQTFYLNSPNQEVLNIQFDAIPDIIPSEFTTTLLMTVVNNMSNNNPLVNLTPNDPGFVCDITTCTKISGPTPTSYGSLDSGDTAVFRWVYQLYGDEDDDIIFTSSLQNQFLGNTDTATVTIGVPVLADVAGQSIETAGFGAPSNSPDSFIFHAGTYGIPPLADHQMSLSSPDTSGTTILFDGVSDKLQFFSANATIEDINIPAGNWNASLRYYSPQLPEGMTNNPNDADVLWADLSDGGHKFHFNNFQTTYHEDSSEDQDCYDLTSAVGQYTGLTAGLKGDLIGGSTWSATGGVNASGAYRFDSSDGIDYILTAQGIEFKAKCGSTDNPGTFSIALWFKGDVTVDDRIQTLMYDYDAKDEDGSEFRVEISDGNNVGHIFFHASDKDGNDTECKASDANYLDGQWHHVAAVLEPDGDCRLYVDANLKTEVNDNADNHVHLYGDLTIGANFFQESASNGFDGWIDDVMFFRAYELTQTDVTALKEASFGTNAHQFTFVISKALGVGTTVGSPLVEQNNYPLTWSDRMHYSITDDEYWAGGNFTASLSAVTLEQASLHRLNFTMVFDSGEDLNFRLDDSNLIGASGPQSLSSYLQVPRPPEPLPVFFTHNQQTRASFFGFNNGDEGVWFTYQGSRIVFNGTTSNLGQHAGIIYSVSNGTHTTLVDEDHDSLFVGKGISTDIVYDYPTYWPQSYTPGNNPGNTAEQEWIPLGTYDVTVFFNGYDEGGRVFLRSINLGQILVVP